MMEHLVPIESDRGLVSMPEIVRAVGHERVSVSENPNLTTPSLWLRVVDTTARSNDRAMIELSATDAWHLAEQLMALVANHYHGDARPAERAADLLEEP